MSSIIIADYNPVWPVLFEEEKARILAVAGSYIQDIQHVGSTSVPGLGAKPIIDIMIGLRDLSHVEQFVQPLRQLGYGYLGEHGIPERHFFRKPDNGSWIARTHQINMIVMGSDFWRRHLLFPDYLRLPPEDARRYYFSKKELAQHFVATQNYTQPKPPLIHT